MPRSKNTVTPWQAYARRLLGVVTAERGLRGETADCLDRERAAGRIR